MVKSPSIRALGVLGKTGGYRHIMNEAIRDRYQARADVMKALAHPSRLYIVDELSRGERCVCDLTEAIGSDMSTVSKHLSVLKSVGIVRDEKRGSQVYYSLRMRCVIGFFGCIEAVLRSGDDAGCDVGSLRARRC